MLLLCCEWLCVNDVVDRLNRNVTQPTVSHHLSTLRDAGLVNTRREGKQIFYSLNQDAVAICCGQIMTMFAPEFSSGTIVEQATINASSPEAEVAIGV